MINVDKSHIHYDYFYMVHNWNEWNSGSLTQHKNNMSQFAFFNFAYNLVIWLRDYNDICLPTKITEIIGLIEEQVRSLTPKRTTVQEEKLQPLDGQILINFIEEYTPL